LGIKLKKHSFEYLEAKKKAHEKKVLKQKLGSLKITCPHCGKEIEVENG